MALAIGTRTSTAQDWARYDGVWEGPLVLMDAPSFMDAEASITIRLEISGETVRVFFVDDGGAQEVKPGSFRIEIHGANAIVSSMDHSAAAPLGQAWIETWVFALTFGDPDTLLTVYTRVVNNTQQAPSEEGSRFSMVRTGMLRRVRGDHV